MQLDEFLNKAGFEPGIIASLLENGFRTPDFAFVFLVNNPSMFQPDVAKQFLPGWPSEKAPEIRLRLIKLLRDSGVISPYLRDIEQDQAAFAASFELGASVLRQDLAKEGSAIKAEDFVREVEKNAQNTGMSLGARALPANAIDLRDQFAWDPQDQLKSSACVAFTVAACVELHRVFHPPKDPFPVNLSPRFLYRRTRGAVMANGAPLAPAFQKGGLRLGEVRNALGADGICTAKIFKETNSWEDADKSTNLAVFNQVIEDQRNEVLQDAIKRRHDMEYLDHAQVGAKRPGMARQVFEWLANRQPVAITVPGFFDPLQPLGESIWSDKQLNITSIFAPLAPTRQLGKLGHAVCIVGYFPDEGAAENLHFQQWGYQPLKGYFLFRNSRGTRFPERPDNNERNSILGNGFPEGYGLMHASVVEYFVGEYGIVKPIP